MFKRTFHSKSSNLLKLSVWKSLKSEWMRVCPHLSPLLITLPQVLGEKVQFHEQKELVELLWITEPSTSMSSSSSSSKQLLAIHLPTSSHLLPSLAVCWQVPNCIPIILIQKDVVKFIFNGADLMAPGILGDLPDVPVESVVGISSESDPKKILGVGILKMTASEFKRVPKGKAVQMIHFLGDKLWVYCGEPQPPSSFDATPTPSTSCGVPQPPTPAPIAEVPVSPPSPPSSTVGDLSPDEKIMEAFLLGLLQVPSFPISASTFHSKHMQAVHKPLDWKASSWKKVTTLLTHMAKTQVVGVKPHGPDLMVVSFDASHALFDQVVISKRKKTHPSSSTTTHGSKTTTSPDPITVKDYFALPPSLQPWFPGVPVHTRHTFSEWRSLVMPTLKPYMHQREVRHLPPTLAETLGGRTQGLVDQVVQELIQRMPQFHVVSSNLTEFHPGVFQPIEIKVCPRQRKRVTVVYQPASLKLWHLPHLVTELKTKCACSVILLDPERVQIQGDQLKLLTKWIHELGFQHLVKFG
ncbi:translation machinery-associated protein 20 [Coelomomyces lativittatus]|nr:translation machinery-associated protein 20 [Coelomomyces lativittatus]KAJ1515718.1 translation machinery-associated protein 20 [Coelomomyces lativittatus]KAJ1516890.1 translation machinery-associated protein 20 [Coelomomyces lativittatus]